MTPTLASLKASSWQRSLDLADLGEALACAGSEIRAAGQTVIALNEPPTEYILSSTRAAIGRAWRALEAIERMERT